MAFCLCSESNLLGRIDVIHVTLCDLKFYKQILCHFHYVRTCLILKPAINCVINYDLRMAIIATHFGGGTSSKVAIWKTEKWYGNIKKHLRHLGCVWNQLNRIRSCPVACILGSDVEFSGCYQLIKNCFNMCSRSVSSKNSSPLAEDTDEYEKGNFILFWDRINVFLCGRRTCWYESSTSRLFNLR
jgi:hypothetical protein